MNKNYDFVVSGAGLIGAITALQLSQNGYSCCLIEKTSLSKKSSYEKPDGGVAPSTLKILLEYNTL